MLTFSIQNHENWKLEFVKPCVEQLKHCWNFLFRCDNTLFDYVAQYVSRVVKYNKKSVQYLTPFFMLTFLKRGTPVCIYAYLTRGLQKYAINLIPMMAFWGQPKAGQKIAVRLAGLAVLSCRYRVYHIEMVVTKWLWGVEESIILLNYGA